MAEIKITQQMINEYRAVTGNYVLTDSVIAEKIKNEPLPEGFNLLAFDAYKTESASSSSNLFGYGFVTDTNPGLSFERTNTQVNKNEQQAKKIASSIKDNSKWYKDWGGSSLVAECKKTTKDNILYTLKEFEKISPDKNLILTITDNTTISVEKQKEALKHIFNVLCDLAKDKGVDTTHFEKAFKTNISQTRTETRVSSTGMPGGTYTKEVLTDSNITTINNIIVGLRNSIEVKANPNVYNQIALALTPEEQIQEQTIGSLKYKHSSSLEALENQNRYDGWAGELADWMSRAWGSKNREKHVRADLEKFNKQITELEDAKKVSKEAFEKKFEEIFGIKYDAELIVNYQQVERLYQMATSCYQLEQFFKSDLKVLLSNSILREETKTVSVDPMTNLTQTTVLATKEQVFEREFNKLANFVGQGNLENGKQQLEEALKASGITENSTLQEKYAVIRKIAQDYAKTLHDNTMQVTGNKGYEAIAKDFDDAYKSAFGVTNDIARRVAEYNVSQQAGAGVIKMAVIIGGTIALGATTGGAGLSFFPKLSLAAVSAGSITAATEFSDRLSSGYVFEGFKENGIKGAIDGAKQALPDEEILRILKSAGIMSLATFSGGILGAGVEIGAQVLKMSILTKALAHIVVGTGVGAGAEYLHTGTVSVQGVVFAFVLSAIGQVIAITKVGVMDNGKVTFDKQAVQQARQDLGLADDVVLTEEVLKKAYRKMVIQTHPDKGGSSVAFVKVKAAYKLLMQYAHPSSTIGASSQTTTKSNPTTPAEANTNIPVVIKNTQLTQQNVSINSSLTNVASRNSLKSDVTKKPYSKPETGVNSLDLADDIASSGSKVLSNSEKTTIKQQLKDFGYNEIIDFEKFDYANSTAHLKNLINLYNVPNNGLSKIINNGYFYSEDGLKAFEIASKYFKLQPKDIRFISPLCAELSEFTPQEIIILDKRGLLNSVKNDKKHHSFAKMNDVEYSSFISKSQQSIIETGKNYDDLKNILFNKLESVYNFKEGYLKRAKLLLGAKESVVSQIKILKYLENSSLVFCKMNLISLLYEVDIDNYQSIRNILEILETKPYVNENEIDSIISLVNKNTEKILSDILTTEDIPINKILEYCGHNDDFINGKLTKEMIIEKINNDPYIKTIRSIKNSQIELNSLKTNITPLNPNNIKASSLALVHMTKYDPKNGIILSTRDKLGGSRNSVHFTLNHAVTAHRAGDWDNCTSAIIMPYESTVKNNAKGKFIEGMPNDLYTNGSVKIPEGSVIVKQNTKLIEGNINIYEHPSLNGVKIIETSLLPHDLVPTVLEKMGYTSIQGDAYLGLFNYGTKKGKSVDNAMDNYRAWNEFCKTQGIKPARHTGTPGAVAEKLIENIGQLSFIGSWTYCRDINYSSLTFLNNLKNLFSSSNNKTDYKKYILNEIEILKDWQSRGFFVSYDLDVMSKIIQESSSPQKALNRIQQELNVHPTRNYSEFYEPWLKPPLDTYKVWIDASEDPIKLREYIINNEID